VGQSEEASFEEMTAEIRGREWPSEEPVGEYSRKRE
jgi:hypothetical protein